MNKDSINYPHVRARLESRRNDFRSWTIDCPYCGKEHYHSGGCDGTDPGECAGHRVPHCLNSDWPQYILVYDQTATPQPDDDSIVAAFIEERCTLTPGALVDEDSLVASFIQWCNEREYLVPGKKVLDKCLKGRGCKRRTRRYGDDRRWEGIEIDE